MKSFGKSFQADGAHPIQSTEITNPSNLWYFNPPSFFDKILNSIATITKFKQSDFSSAIFGDEGILFVSLYPPEKGFFNNKLGSDILSDLPLNFVTGLGKNRINYIQTHSNYFNDLCNEYSFLKSNNGLLVRIGNKIATYVIITGYSDLLNEVSPDIRKLYIIVTIEGSHCFDEGFDIITNPTEENFKRILENVDTVKNWIHRPVFISMAHHFYNGMCGHCFSLDGFVSKLVDQKPGTDKGFSEIGLRVLHRLLNRESDKRILIDIKHMNEISRNEYYSILSSEYFGENIPIVVSHGCVNGYKTSARDITIPGAPALFNSGEINFYDFELVKIAQSGGIFGVQLDERRIASKEMIKKAKGKIWRKKILFSWSKLVWNQIEHIAKVLNINGLPAWNTACLGTDYDGIIDPIGGYWTEEDIKYLEGNLIIHATEFMQNSNFNQKMDPTEVVQKFKSGNALEFLKRSYK
jgi:microsomal dipeptidase-like Zn-dependent dipeptidase